MNLTLDSFTRDAAAEVAGWADSAEEVIAWAGQEVNFPVRAAQFEAWHSDPYVVPRIARLTGDLVAYGEIWIDREAGEIELARIIVDPTNRGSGIGRFFVKLLLDDARGFNLPNVFLRVRPENTRAIRCYHAAGFHAVSSDDQKLFNRGQPVDYVWMKH